MKWQDRCRPHECLWCCSGRARRLLSSEVVAKAFVGARLVKAFNHLPAAQLGTNPPLEGQQQVVFISSNDAEASATVAALATQVGFAPIELGRLDQGGVPLHAVDGELAAYCFKM